MSVGEEEESEGLGGEEGGETSLGCKVINELIKNKKGEGG